MIVQAELLDWVLAAVLPLCAWSVIASAELRRAVVLFIALGLLSALAWARLAAPDIALVEAAVGTGLTGALLMSALGWAQERQSRADGAWLPRAAFAAALVPIGCLVAGLLALAPTAPGLGELVLAELEHSGVTHPVTAVLLNYRGYDTFLEILVLVVAAIGIERELWAPRGSWLARGAPHGESLVDTLARLVVPGFVLVAGYLVWKGAHEPGGAFQAGAVVAGGGVLLLLARRLRPLAWTRAMRIALCVGPLFFLAVAAAPLVREGLLLHLRPPWAGPLILAVESVLVLTIGLTLTSFFPADALPGAAASEREGGEA